MKYFYKEYAKNQYVVYIYDKKILSLNKNIDITHGYIDYAIDKKEKILTIRWVQTRDDFRGKGYAKFLIQYVINRYKRFIKQIELDDCSDRMMKPNNIYTKLGFQYIENDMPEMIMKFK